MKRDEWRPRIPASNELVHEASHGQNRGVVALQTRHTCKGCSRGGFELTRNANGGLLLTKHKKAFETYMRGVSELAEAAGMMAHTEFEYLYNKVRTARQFLVQAREQLNEHTLKHGC